MESYFDRVLLGAVINLGLLLPFFLFAFLTTPRSRVAVKPVLLFAVFLLLDIASVWLFKWVEFIPSWGAWNWQGKLLEAAWPVVLVLCAPGFTTQGIGLTPPASARHWRELVLVCLLYVVIFVPVALLFMGAHLGIGGDVPTFAYEATMPGLGEELMYRGLLLMLLNQAFGRPWKVAGIQFGWGFIIVTAMFGILHGVDAPSVGRIQIVWTGMIFPVIIGLILAWLRERTGSVWPGVLFHNMVNVINHILV